MGNYWLGISTDYLVQSEVRMLHRAGLRHEDYKFLDVKLDKDADPNYLNIQEDYIHCIDIKRADILQDKELPIMVLIHGYGAGGCVFYKILKDLSQYFHLYVVDLLGMGSSGRPQYTGFQGVDQAEEFFVESLKVWKEKVGIQKKYILAGHSFGGYISSVYALKYPLEIERLLLLSPVGIPEKPSDFNANNIVQRFNSWPKRIGVKMIINLWERNYSPFDVMRVMGKMGTSTFLNMYMRNRMKAIQVADEMQDFKAYLHQIFLRPASGEYALNTILSVGSWARSPLLYRLPTIQVPLSFFYGEVDWMDSSHALIMIQNKMVDARLYIIEKADHHLYLDNPIDTVFKIIVDVFGDQQGEQYLNMKKREIEGIQEPTNQIDDNGEIREQIIT